MNEVFIFGSKQCWWENRKNISREIQLIHFDGIIDQGLNNDMRDLSKSMGIYIFSKIPSWFLGTLEFKYHWLSDTVQ